MHCQLLGVVAAVEIDIHAQQELVEPGGSSCRPKASPRPQRSHLLRISRLSARMSVWRRLSAGQAG